MKNDNNITIIYYLSSFRLSCLASASIGITSKKNPFHFQLLSVDESEKVVKVVSVSVVPVCGCGWVVWRCRHTAPRLLRTARRCASLRQGAPGAALWCACRRGAGEPTPAAARERESKEVKVSAVLCCGDPTPCCGHSNTRRLATTTNSTHCSPHDGITTLDLQISLVSYVATIKPRTKEECSLLWTLDRDRDTVLLLD